MKINLNLTLNGKEPKGERHNCTSERIEDVFVFKCDKCPGFQRKLNFVTGEVETTYGNESQRQILHGGTFASPGLDIEAGNRLN